MRKFLTIAAFLCLLLPVRGQVMMLISSDSLFNITSPLAIDSLYYWFDASQGVTDSLGGAIANNEGVGTWNDLSGHGYHVTQTTNTARPVWKSSGGSGGYPGIQFDGSNDYLASAAHFWGSDDITVIVVMKFANATRDATEATLTMSNSGTNKRQWLMYSQAAAASYRLSFGTSSAGTAATFAEWYSSSNTKHTNFKIHVFDSDGADGDWYTDGATITATSDAVTAIFNDSTNRLGIGVTNASGTPSAFLQGSICEIIGWAKQLSTAEHQAMELYVNRKYDLY